MELLTLYTGKAGLELIKKESSVWATSIKYDGDIAFTVNKEDAQLIEGCLYEVSNYESVQLI